MTERIKNEILKFFPNELKEKMPKFNLEELREIRIRIERPVILKLKDKEIIMQNAIIDREKINRTFENICSNSIYAFGDEISNGFITVLGGHRIGISGKPLYKEGKIYTIKDISGLNFRVAREIIGAADKIIPKIMLNNKFVSVLIISPPGLGKTTLLRDLIRQVSNRGYDVSLVDERSEIAACFMGVPQNDVGLRTDVMDNVQKHDGIKLMVRSMKPDFIATDEIGTDKDAEAIAYALNSGVQILATAHASNLEELKKNNVIKKILENGIFKRLIVLKNNDFEIYNF